MTAKNILQMLHLLHQDFHKRFRRKFTNKWRLSSEVEVWNLAKNKLLKLVNLMKVDFLFAALCLNTIFQDKKRQTKACFMDDALKRRVIKSLDVETRLLLFALPCQNF